MKKGFTLIELLIVIAIIAILAGVVFVSLNPLQRFQDARNSARWTDVTAILSAIKVDQVDNGGQYLSAIDGLTAGQNYMISGAAVAPITGCNTNCSVTPAIASGNCTSLDGLKQEGYLAKIPVGPAAGSVTWSDNYTGYYMLKSSLGVITIGACSAEGGETITVNR